MDDEVVSDELQPEPTAKGGSGCLLWAVLLPVLLIGGCFAWASVAGDDGDASGYAKVACRDWVKDRLKSPSSAKFSDEVVEPNGETRYEVTGSVDSENSFGAMIRNRYRCLVEHDGEASTLIDLKVTGN
ncbi:MAG: hypothetical protein QM714_00220 [Nocardioides sp.]|uniref:hypothetical protein n=1 Tax=Nocardioides sp. TaxID=35761 RepID=UPI0039E3FDB8